VEELSALDPGGAYRSGWSGLSDAGLLSAPLLDQLNVSCVLATEPLDVSGLELAFQRPGFCVHRRTSAVGRARLLLEDGSTSRSGVQLVQDEPGESIWLVSTSMAATLLLSQEAGPDWRVEVDDAPLVLERPDRWSLRVPLSPGTHTVRCTYSPSSFALGSALSGLAMLLALLLTSFHKPTSQRDAPPVMLEGDASPDPR
jgi:hypothetical protein